MSANGQWAEVSTIGDLLVRSAHRHPDRDALVFPDSRHTYAELRDRAVCVARGLFGLGVHPGDRVGLLASNTVEYVEGFFGVSLLGAVIVPLNARHRSTELGWIIDNGDLVAVLTTAREDEYLDFTDVLRTGLPSLGDAPDPRRLSLPEAPALRAAVLLSGEGRAGFLSRQSFDEVANLVEPETVDEMRRRVRIRDVAAVLYTSGTTANPKGCMLSQEAMTRGPVERAQFRLGNGDTGTGQHDVTWAAGPLFHIGALAPFLGAMGTGGTFLTDIHFEPGRALQLLSREHATVAFPWFPAMMQPLLDHPTFDAAALQSLQSMFLIGPSVLLERVQDALPSCELVAACGMTETAGIYAISDRTDSVELRATAQGKPCPGMEIRIIDIETGQDVGPGIVGEILVRGHSVMEGYYRDPEKTAASLDDDRWLHTGDLLKVGGENVAAIEIESFLARHPAVQCVEIVGAPDPRLDEVPVAFVEVRPGHDITEAELIAFCQGQIARFKIPRAVRFVEPRTWPMSATKINKRALRAQLAEAVSAAPEPA
jgi:acyl-CoA synthetase (AMP-forming)/AMP-acid ligase II